MSPEDHLVGPPPHHPFASASVEFESSSSEGRSKFINELNSFTPPTTVATSDLMSMSSMSCIESDTYRSMMGVVSLYLLSNTSWNPLLISSSSNILGAFKNTDHIHFVVVKVVKFP
uniref:(northern house mosquito) hypothetical protein n=1 Tax=Culex pipiens TaxID=7175 RepID=A0A8D8FC25_CULPI